MTKSQIKILCVEDEKEIRENLVEILQDEGFEVFSAENGKYGFAEFIAKKPDIIISDIMMPEVDGYKFLSMVRQTKNSKNNQIPFIFLTALGQKDDMIKGLDLSANDYLIKPIDFDLLIAKIKQKVSSVLKIKESYAHSFNKIKEQLSTILPIEIASYLGVINSVSQSLKSQPYGPLPHENYLRDFNKIYLNSIKLATAVTNAFDPIAIERKLNADEEIIFLPELIEEFIGDLSEKFRNKVELGDFFSDKALPKIRIDKTVLNEALKKILAGVFKSDPAGILKMSMMLDHQDRMLIIFSFSSAKIGNENLFMEIDEAQISKILDQQNCLFEICEGRQKVAVLIIPSHRIISFDRI